MASIIDLILGKVPTSDPLDSFVQSVGGPAPEPRYGSGPQGPAMSMAPVAAPVADPNVPPPVQQPDMAVTANDRWHPKKTTLLGTIADIVTGSTAFHDKTKRDNLRSAFEGFDENPLRTIRRVAKINPDAAWQMYNVYHDNKIQDDVAKSREEDETFDRGMGLLAAANPSNYKALKQRTEQYWQNKGFDPGMALPDEYDPDQLQGMRESHMQAKDQLTYEMNNSYKNARLEDFDRIIGNNEQDDAADNAREDRKANSLDSYRRIRAGQFERKLKQDAGVKGQFKPIKTKYGTGMYDPKKNTMTIVVNGKEHKYAHVGTANGQDRWQLLGEVDDSEDDDNN